MRDLHYVTWTRAYANTKGQQTAGSGVCALVQVRCLVQASTSIRLKSLPVQNPFLLFVSAVVLSNRQPGTRKTHLGSCLLLLTQRANNMLTYSHEVLPVLCCSSCADVIWPTLTLAMTRARVHEDILYCTCMWMLINSNSTHSRFEMLYQLPISFPGQGKARGSRAVVVSLGWVLPVLIGDQVEISLKGAVGTGEGRAGCFGPLSMTYNLICPEFGMHPLAGHSLVECVRASLHPLSITNSKQFAEQQIAIRQWTLI